jgi:N-acetyl sugar amidotransferase
MQLTKQRSLQPDYRICSRCIYDTSVPSISFDNDGVCNFCRMTDSLLEEFGTGMEKGETEIRRLVDEIKKKGKNKKYDCIIGVSGGTDSSYLLHWAVANGLRPLAVHYDNTFNTAIATLNITKLTSKLKIDLYTHVINNAEMEDIFRSFFLASVPELDAPTDIGCPELLYRVAQKYGLKYVIEGHSFLEEGITPLGKNYFDGKYVSSIHKMFGRVKMKTFPLMTFYRFMYAILWLRIKKIRPFWYIKYTKEDAKKILADTYDWEDYKGHHLENRVTAYLHGVYYPLKFDIDFRNNTLAARVRNGKMNREDAIHEYYETEPYLEEGLVEYMKKRMGFSDEEYERVMMLEKKYWFEYPTYKKRFEQLRPLFKMLYKVNLVPKSFYLKYCFPLPIIK